MSDLSDLEGVYPTALRWNAEAGVLGISAFNPETGERELRPIDFGKAATFAMDLGTRERGYGLIKIATYDMRLTSVGSPPPPWPGDPEFKPALGCWLWNPTYGELRLETNASLFRIAITRVWECAAFDQQAVSGQQPVIRFEGKTAVAIKAVGKTFQSPIIKIIGWVERDKVPGWAARTPTVAAPSAPPLLAASAEAKIPAPETSAAKKPAKTKKGTTKKPDPNDSLDGLLGDDIAWK
jgi:hypothetical protein